MLYPTLASNEFTIIKPISFLDFTFKILVFNCTERFVFISLQVIQSERPLSDHNLFRPLYEGSRRQLYLCTLFSYELYTIATAKLSHHYIIILVSFPTTNNEANHFDCIPLYRIYSNAPAVAISYAMSGLYNRSHTIYPGEVYIVVVVNTAVMGRCLRVSADSQ